VAVFGFNAFVAVPLPVAALLGSGVACFLDIGFLIGGVVRTQEAVMARWSTGWRFP
jgi:hypothetical protein